jgi:serine/threonine-protein kinase RsbW
VPNESNDPNDATGVPAHATLQVPADGAYLATARLTAASLAARADLTVDEIEDLRLALDEACALLLPLAAPGSMLALNFGVRRGSIEVVASVPAPPSSTPERGGFAWAVLSALASEVSVAHADGRLAITVIQRREAATS